MYEHYHSFYWVIIFLYTEYPWVEGGCIVPFVEQEQEQEQGRQTKKPFMCQFSM